MPMTVSFAMPSATRSARARVAIAICATLAGCAVGPDYVRPEITLPTTFKEAPDEKSGAWQPAQPNDAAARGAWWSVFNDPELDALERRVEISNQDLRAAVARFDQALALAQRARAAYFPTTSAAAADTRSRTGPNTGVNRTASLAFAADWEADVWGRVRRSVESGAASAQASRADLEGTRLATQAQLAQDYFLLRIADAQLRLFDETVSGYTKSLELTRNRYSAGVVTRADVAQAETQLTTPRAQQIDADINRAQLEHSIAVLCGEAPANFALAARAELPNAPSLPQIPAALPVHLLERRPDIAGAERRAAAANAQIGVAQAAYFPTLSLAASGGWRGSNWSDLISLPNRVWSVGPQLAATLFDGGARRAATAAARAGFEQTAAQ